MKLSKFIKTSDLMQAPASSHSGAQEEIASDTSQAAPSALPPPTAPSAMPSVIASPQGPARTSTLFTKNRMPEPAPATPQESLTVEDIAHDARPAARRDEPLFDEQPMGIYEAAAQLGIHIPESRETIVSRARNCLMTIFRTVLLGTSNRGMIWPMVKSITNDIEGIIAEDANIVTLLHRYRVQKEKILWHSLYTSILAMDLARNVRSLGCSMQDIGGAALLHDIGLLTEPGALDIVDFEPNAAFHDHVNRGVELAREIKVPDIVVEMIAQHHRRLDDQAPESEPFPIHCQIVAIANLFEHAVIDLSVESRNGAAPKNDMSSVFKQFRKAFDDDLLKKMISLIGFYPVGSMVELNNRAICEVIRQNEDMPLRPVVKVIMDGFGNHPETTRIIDLTQVRVLSIIRTVATVVRPP